MMDANDDYRSHHTRERMIKALENVMRDRPGTLPPRFPQDPRQLELVIFQSATAKEDYFKKITKIFQMLGVSGAQLQNLQNITMAYGGAGGGQIMPPMMMTEGMQQQQQPPQIQQQPAPPNATVSTAPLPPQQQQPGQHYGMMPNQMDVQTRMIQPPPNPYQQQLGGGMQQQQIGMQQQQPNMIIPSQPQQQHMMQQQQQQPQMVGRMPATRHMVSTARMPNSIMSDGARYGSMPQERPGEFVRLSQPARFTRAPVQQQQVPPQHPPMQQPQQWSGAPQMIVPSSTVPSVSETVVIPGSTTRLPNTNVVYQQTPIAQPGGYPPRGAPVMQPQQHPNQQQAQMSQHPSMQQQRFEPPQRMPMGNQQYHPRQQIQFPHQQQPPQPPMVPQPSHIQMPPSMPLASPSTGQQITNPPSTGPPTIGSVPPYLQESSPYQGVRSVEPIRPNYQPEQSPAGQIQPETEDPVYKEKIQELQMYLGPLKRMLEQRQGEGDQNSQQTQKLLRIIGIIEGKDKATLDLLLRCEDTLKKMVPKKPEEPQKAKESAICQPLFEVVASLVKAPNANRILKRVFDLDYADISSAKRLYVPKNPDEPSPRTIEENFAIKMLELESEPAVSESPPKQDGNSVVTSTGTAKIPLSVQREVALLESRFRIILDRAFPNTTASSLSSSTVSSKGDSSRFIHVICDLEDTRLPHVPSLRLQIPNDYPNSSPKYDCDLSDYSGSPFLDSLREMLVNRLTKLGTNCSITSLLDNWESTVRQACYSQ